MAEAIKCPPLRTGKTYRASVIVETETFAPSTDRIKDKLQDMGFEEVQVWDSADDLPPDWQGDDRKDTSDWGQTQYWGRGAWAGEDGKEIDTKGDGWTITWLYAEASETPPKEPGEPKPPEPARFEQKAQSNWMTKYLPSLSVMAANTLAVTLWVKGSKEN